MFCVNVLLILVLVLNTDMAGSKKFLLSFVAVALG
jgi:hypothetical protein